ncbi:unnamed protein product, partial [Symbiodinium microadriaticum]
METMLERKLTVLVIVWNCALFLAVSCWVFQSENGYQAQTRYTEIMRCAMVFEPFVAAWNIVVAPEVWIRKAQKCWDSAGRFLKAKVRKLMLSIRMSFPVYQFRESRALWLPNAQSLSRLLDWKLRRVWGDLKVVRELKLVCGRASCISSWACEVRSLLKEFVALEQAAKGLEFNQWPSALSAMVAQQLSALDKFQVELMHSQKAADAEAEAAEAEAFEADAEQMLAPFSPVARAPGGSGMDRDSDAGGDPPRQKRSSISLVGKFIKSYSVSEGQSHQEHRRSSRAINKSKKFLRKVFSSYRFGNFMLMVVLVDAYCTCRDIDARATGVEADAVFTFLSDFCLVLYSLELCGLLFVRGREILKDWMIVVDILVVICGYVEFILVQVTPSELVQKMSLLRALRLARIFRLMRLLRKIRALRELYKLVTMMSTCLKTLLWSKWQACHSTVVAHLGPFCTAFWTRTIKFRQFREAARQVHLDMVAQALPDLVDQAICCDGDRSGASTTSFHERHSQAFNHILDLDLRGGGGRGKGKEPDNDPSNHDQLFNAIVQVLGKYGVSSWEERKKSRAKSEQKQQKSFLEALQQSLDRYRRKPHDRLLQSITSIVQAAQAGKLSMESPPAEAETSSADKGKGKNKGKGANDNIANTAAQQKDKSKGKGKSKVVKKKKVLSLQPSSWGPKAIMTDDSLRQALVKDIPELPQNPVTQSTQKPTELQLHVFRITVPSIFLDNARWLHICTSPQKALHALIDPLELHSSYGWKKTTVGTAEKQERGLFVKAPPCVQNGRSIELQEALLGAGWTEIQVLYPPRGKQPWLIKAKPPPNSEGEILGVATGDFTLYLSRVPPRAPHVVGIKPVHITRKAQPAHEVNLNTEAEDLETELEDPPSADANMTGEAAKDPAKKRDPPEKQSPLKKKHKESAPNFLQGYELKDCCGDGACGYNSLAFAYWLSNNADKPHPSNEEIKTMGRTLRQQIHQHICKHQGKYSATFATDARWTKETEGREVPTTFDSWLLALLRPQRWICQTTLQAAANRLGVHITVLINNQNDTRAVHIPCQQLNFATTVVIYLKDKHYQAVLPTRKAWPLEWTSQRLHGLVAVGDPLFFFTTGAFDSSYLDARAVTDFFEKKAQCSMAPGCYPEGHSMHFYFFFLQEIFGKRGQGCTEDIPFEDRGTRINRTEIVEASFDVPEGERDWECPFRHEYLPQFGNYHQKQKNVRHHYDTKHPRRNTSPGAIQKALAKSVKKDPSRFPKKKSGYMQAAAKRRAKERDLGLNGHKLIAFQPVWSEWPRPKKGKPQKGQLFTCQKCWGIANYNKHMWKPCTGSRGEASRQAVNRWAGICAGPSGDNVSTLLACWGTTKAEADMYFNHLEEEGVEPNPGPETPGGADDDDDGGSDDDDPDPSDPSSTASHEQSDQTQSSTARSSVRVSCVNVRDGPGLWRLVKILECDSSFTDVICIQESCIHAEEYNTVANKFSAMGFKAYWAEGSPGKKATGGCVTVVRSTIPHRVVEIFSGGPHQHICIEFKSSWMVCNSYIPPRQHLRYIAHQAFTEILHKIKLSAGGRPWIALGDYNALPQEMEAVFSPHGGTLFYQQCRFQGNRYIDHIWSNEHNFLAEGKVLPYKVSDHKWFSTIRWDAESHRCVRRRGHVWSSPPGVPFATWKEHLAVTWEQCDRSFLESFAAAEANPSQATVDMVWQEWNSYLHNFFSVATSSFSQSLQGSSRTGLAAWSKKAEQAGSKPSKPHLQWIPKLVRRESGNMACRKRCNWLSRAERVLELMNKSSRSHNQDTELQRLMCRIRRRMPSTHEFPVFVRQLAEEIKQTQKQQAQEERETKDLFIQRWRHSMQYSVSERCKWLRKSKQCRPYVLHGDRQLDKDQDILNAICEHWQATWRACKHAPVQPKIQVVLNNLPEQVPLSGRPDLEDFSTALKELGGSSGPDDWQLEELRCLPPGAIPLFSRLTCTWEASGCTPGTLKYSRQVNLAKPHKIVNGCTKSSDLRPINVYSLWYRWWSGSWAKSKLLRSWRQRVFPAEITGGLNSPGSEHLAAKLQDALVQHGYLATLDYSLAFDHVVPAAVSLGMERLGLPKALSSVLLDQWTHQKRILQWN